MAKSILSTATLSSQLIADAAAKGIVIDAIPFTTIRFCVTDDLVKNIMTMCTKRVVAIFTSANSVKAIAHILQPHNPEWAIYCTRNATKDELLRYVAETEIKGVGDDAAMLAKMILNDGHGEVVFFCGDSRMETLPELLKSRDVSVQELVVYESEETPVAIDKVYDAVLFYSPSGVRGFFSRNKVGKQTALFAIGNTTSAAIAEHTDQQVYVCETPSKVRMVQDAVCFLI